MKPMTARKLRIYLLIAAIPVLAIATLLQGTAQIVVGILGLMLFAASLVAQFFWRCPSCGRFLPNERQHLITHCPYCGNLLDQEL